MPRMKAYLLRPHRDLESWRKGLRLTQHEAAVFLGISHRSYQRYEHGERTMRGSLAKQVMEKTGVPLETLVGAI